MTRRRSAPNRFAATSQMTIGEMRNSDRALAQRFNDNRISLPNPDVSAPFDRHGPQSYKNKVEALGLAPNAVEHFWQLERGDAGAAASSYRRIETFQLLAATGDRTASTPYSKAVEIATYRSSDQRPRNFHVSMFSVGRQFASAAGSTPLSEDEVARFAAGIPAGTTSVSGTFVPGVPQYSTAQFRVMIFDESGQRFVDVDVIGTRSMNFYAWGVTVFALIKEDGYVINRQVDTNAALGPGLIDQGIVAARIIPLQRNETNNVNNRSVTVRTPSGASTTVVPIPPGALTVQGITSPSTPAAAHVLVNFFNMDPLDPLFGVFGAMGNIDFLTTQSDLQVVPNANAIVIFTFAANPIFRNWSFVFGVTS